MQDLIVQILQDLLYFFVVILVGLASNWVKKHVGVQKLKAIQHEIDTHKDLAELAVKYAQEKFSNNGDKYDAAVNWLAKKSASAGLNLDPDDIEVLIESALKKVKSELGDAWNSSVSDPATDSQDGGLNDAPPEDKPL